MWCCSLNHKCWLMILASLWAISKYVVLFFEAQVLAHDFGLCVPSVCMWCSFLKHKCWFIILASLCAISMYVVLLFEAQVLAHDFGLFVCHQYVCGVVI